MAKVSEHDEQCAVIQWAQLHERKYPALSRLHAIPNGGKRNIVVAKKLKAEGVKAGVSDLCMTVPRGEYHGLYIEMKAIGGRLSDAQSEWINRSKENDYAAFVCYGAKEAIEILEWYLKLPKYGG